MALSSYFYDYSNISKKMTEIPPRVREAIASLEAEGIRDWQILSAWSELLHERGDFKKGEVLSMATQLLVEAEVKAQKNE
ncbi:MAG: hypothetical protein M3O33_15270 [Cyanobacteriota bacterium]|jgi:hypothetical protein|nr:hypothetical protein [Cyanobacteriota bacterium]